MDLCFAVHNMAKFSSNNGKVHFEVLVKLLRYIRDNKNSGMKYYAKIEDAIISGILIQSIINTENQLIVLSDSSWNYCPDAGRSTVAYIVVYQCGTIDHFTHVLGPISQSSSYSEYNTAFTAGISLALFRILNN